MTRLRVVVDANIAVAALIRPGGWTAEQLARDDVHWLAPAFLLDELAEHATEYAAKAGCGVREWRRRLAALVARVELVPATALLAVKDDKLVLAVARIDPDDAPYAAALVASGADLLWTRDEALFVALPGIAVAVVPATS